MFDMFKVKRKIDTPAEELLENIRSILYPPCELKEEVDEKTGEKIKFQVDYSIDMNLDAAIIDVTNGHSDEVVLHTLNDVLERLQKIRSLLEANLELHPDAKYYIVDTKREFTPVDILALDDGVSLD